MLRRVAVVAFLVAVASGAASAAPSTTRPTTVPVGRSSVAWPMLPDAEFVKTYNELIKRHSFKVIEGYPQKIRSQFLSTPQPTYELYLPKDYAPDKPIGVLVWISSGDRGDVPRDDWLPVLDKHNLLWLGVNHVGNNADTLWRHYMALEAARQAKEHFTVDPARVYVAGLSGGGRIASHVALVNPDTFTGGFYVVGCDFFRDTPVDPAAPKHAGKFYRGFWRKPVPKLIQQSKLNRFVLLTGEHDFNRANTKSVFAGYQQAGYKHVTLLDIPGHGHEVPDAQWFEKGIAFLDSVRPQTRPTKPTTRPKPAAGKARLIRPPVSGTLPAQHSGNSRETENRRDARR